MIKTEMSITKVTNTLINFYNQGLIEQGLSVKNAKSYIVTDKGMTELLKLKGMDIKWTYYLLEQVAQVANY